MANPYAKNQYLKTQVETATKEQLVVMLFDGIVRFTEQARKSIRENDIENIHQHLMRAQAIVMELIYTVDREKGGDVAQSLLALHAYAFNCLIQANMKRDESKIDEVQEIYRQLRGGWTAAMGNLGISSTTSQTAAPSRPAAVPAPAQANAAPQTAEIHPRIAKLPSMPATAPKLPETSASIAKPAATGYAMGKTAGAAMQAHQRSAAMLSAYQYGGRSIA